MALNVGAGIVVKLLRTAGWMSSIDSGLYGGGFANFLTLGI